jgi:hypothetical protein
VLAPDHGGLVLTVMRDGAGDPWHARVEGADAPAQAVALRKMAARIALATLDDRAPTRSVPALLEFRDGLAALDGGDGLEGRKTLDQARAHLISAMQADPNFWQARLRLVEATRRLGELDLARRLLTEMRKEGAGDVQVLDYQEVMVRARSSSYGDLRFALKIIEERIFQRPWVSAEGWNLIVGARAVRAVVCGALLSLIFDGDPLAIEQGAVEFAGLEKKLQEECQRFRDECPDGIDPVLFRLAGAMALTAQGAWANRLHDGRAARGPLLDALSRKPDYVAALVGLARAYRRERKPDWFEASRPWRERALVLSPSDPDANYEQGRALEDREPPAPVEAAACFERVADRHAGARFRLGQLKVETDVAAGIGLILEAIRMSRAPETGWASAALRELARLPPDAKDAAALQAAPLREFARYLLAFMPDVAGELPEAARRREVHLHRTQHDLGQALRVLSAAVEGGGPQSAAALAVGQLAARILVEPLPLGEEAKSALAALGAASSPKRRGHGHKH